MKKYEILSKYNLSRGAYYALINLGKIVIHSRYNSEVIDEDFVKSFDYEKYKQEYHNSEEYKKKISERNTKVNQARWSKATEEDKQAHKEKCRQGVLKSQAEHPEQIEKMKAGLREYWSNEDNRQAQSERMTEVYKDEEKRQHIKDGCKLYWSDESHRQAQSERMTGYWTKHPEKLEQMRKTNREAQLKIWTPEKREEQSKTLIAVWAKHGHEMLEKAAQTMKRNGTSNFSKPAKESIQLLIDAGFTVTPEKPYPEKRWKCDAYIEELDCWLEFHYGLFHNWMPYDESNPAHVKQAKYLYENYWGQKRKKGHYIYYTWTDLDVRKRNYAKETGMTWFEFYSKGDFEQWLKTLLS